jgi:hypothetical protein
MAVSGKNYRKIVLRLTSMGLSELLDPILLTNYRLTSLVYAELATRGLLPLTPC